jgi:uncharacterized protein
MSLSNQINEDIKDAMKTGQKERLMTLRDIKSKILLEMTKEGGGGEIDDNRIIAILNKLYKQRIESIDIFRSQGRADLVDVEEQQAAVIKTYLPEQLDDQALSDAIRKIISETGASSLSDLGKVMGTASKALAGKADGRAISDMAKKLLSGQ